MKDYAKLAPNLSKHIDEETVEADVRSKEEVSKPKPTMIESKVEEAYKYLLYQSGGEVPEEYANDAEKYEVTDEEGVKSIPEDKQGCKNYVGFGDGQIAMKVGLTTEQIKMLREELQAVRDAVNAPEVLEEKVVTK